MHIFYLQALQPEWEWMYSILAGKLKFSYKVVAISTPRLPSCPVLGQVIDSEHLGTIIASGFQVVVQPIEESLLRHQEDSLEPDSFFYGRKREIHIAPGYRVKRDTVPHQILPQSEPVLKVDEKMSCYDSRPADPSPVRRKWWEYWW